jgi:two-component system, OmpR family, phosphate regulon response regulator PhoB
MAAEALRPLILICDDERPLRELIKAALGERYRFVEAADTIEAEELIAGDPPALLVLDVMLPGRSGLELLDELRDRPETAALPVVMISAWHGEYERTALDAGASAFLGKPFDPDELADTVERLVAA